MNYKNNLTKLVEYPFPQSQYYFFQMYPSLIVRLWAMQRLTTPTLAMMVSPQPSLSSSFVSWERFATMNIAFLCSFVFLKRFAILNVVEWTLWRCCLGSFCLAGNCKVFGKFRSGLEITMFQVIGRRQLLKLATNNMSVILLVCFFIGRNDSKSESVKSNKKINHHSIRNMRIF
jgi:hypothetical protein